MSDERDFAKRAARLLKFLAKKLEEKPELLTELDPNFMKISRPMKTKKIKQQQAELDIFEVYANDGKQKLREKLELLDMNTLKKIISLHSFDSSRLAEKWKNKDKLLDLIVKRVEARVQKGRVFKNYP